MSFSSSISSSLEEVWTTAFQELGQRMRSHFIRPEPHQRALAYIQGLMSDAPRKNGWQVAEAIGEATPYAVQHLLDRAKWDCDGVRDALAAYIMEMLATPEAVIVIDETGFLKKGDKFAYYLAWSTFRRAYQARARLCHYKRRYALICHLQL